MDDLQTEVCDECGAAMPEEVLLEHFRTEHPEEFKKRCVRPDPEKAEETLRDPDPAYPCGCGEVHRRSERCGPW